MRKKLIFAALKTMTKYELDSCLILSSSDVSRKAICEMERFLLKCVMQTTLVLVTRVMMQRLHK